MLKLPFLGSYPLSQKFGEHPEYYKQFQVKQPDGSIAPLRGHNGRDYALPSGTDVFAPHDGEIIEVAFDQNGYGNYVKIENEEEGSVLAHLESVDVQVGFLLVAGDKIGRSDNTGYSTGAHLHWGWYKKPRDRGNGYGGFEDQEQFIEGVSPGHAPTPSGSPPVSGKLYTAEEYDSCMVDRQKFWGERDAAIAATKELQKKYDADMANYSAMKALGYNTIDDINKKFEGTSDTIETLKKENIEVLKRNADLARTIAESEEQDHKTAQEGMDALEENKKLKDELANVAKACGTDPKGAVSKIVFFRELAERFLDKVSKEHDKQEADKKEAQKPDPAAIKTLSAFDTIIDIFNGIF